jgi:hypothetical protein
VQPKVEAIANIASIASTARDALCDIDVPNFMPLPPGGG